MNTKYLKKHLEQLYKNENNIIAETYGLPISWKQDELNAFHAENVAMITAQDDYFLGARADHFIIEIGTSETQGEETYADVEVFLISANHKGTRYQLLLRGERLNR